MRLHSQILVGLIRDPGAVLAQSTMLMTVVRESDLDWWFLSDDHLQHFLGTPAG